MDITGTCLEVSLFSTNSGPGLEMWILLKKTEATAPDVQIKLVAYSKLVPRLKMIKKGSTVTVTAVPRNGSRRDQVYFLCTYIKT
jgi:hypothetical protein